MKLHHSSLALLVVFIWALNFVLCKITLQTLPPLFMIACRFGLTAMMAVWFVRVPYGHLKTLFVLSISMGVCHFGLLFYGLSGIDSGSAVIAFQTQMPFTILLACIFLKERVSAWQVVGIVLAFGGLVFVAGEPRILEHIDYFMIVVVSAFFWALGNLQMKKLNHLNGVVVNVWLSTFSFVHLIILSFLMETDHWVAIQSTPFMGWVGLVYTSAISLLVGYGLWHYLLGLYPVSKVVPYTLVVPVLTIFMGYMVLDEKVSMQKIIGSAIVLCGVSFILLKPPKPIELREELTE
jgi:O-acetylserine/cysteine efflux transporter